MIEALALLSIAAGVLLIWAAIADERPTDIVLSALGRQGDG